MTVLAFPARASALAIDKPTPPADHPLINQARLFCLRRLCRNAAKRAGAAHLASTIEGEALARVAAGESLAAAVEACFSQCAALARRYAPTRPPRKP